MEEIQIRRSPVEVGSLSHGQALEVVPGRRVWGWQPKGRVSLVAMLLWMDVEKAGKDGVGQDFYGLVIFYVYNMYIFM